MNKNIVVKIVNGLAVYGAFNIIYNLGKHKGMDEGMALGEFKAYVDLLKDEKKKRKFNPKHSKKESY